MYQIVYINYVGTSPFYSLGLDFYNPKKYTGINSCNPKKYTRHNSFAIILKIKIYQTKIECFFLYLTI